MEKWDLYDVHRVSKNKTIIRGNKLKDGDYHTVIHVCIFNSNNEMLIQQRQPFKEGWSNLWDLTVGGSIISGETSQQGAQRELFEEVGIDIDLTETRPVFTTNTYDVFDDIYCITKDDVDIAKLNLQYEEVQAVKWADLETILEMIDSGLFINYKPSLIKLIFDMKDCPGGFSK